MSSPSDTAEAARRVVEAVRYERPKDHDDKVVIVMIESVEAIERSPQILAVDGGDIFLSAQMTCRSR